MLIDRSIVPRAGRKLAVTLVPSRHPREEPTVASSVRGAPMCAKSETRLRQTCAATPQDADWRRGAGYRPSYDQFRRQHAARAMIDAAAAHVDRLPANLLGWGVLALLIAAAVALHMRRSRRRLGRPRGRRLLQPFRRGIAAPPTTSVLGATDGPRSAAEPPAGVSLLVDGSRADAASSATARPPALTHARYSRETFELLAQNVDQSRRLALTEARVQEILSTLPRDRWLVERYVLRAGHRVPFLILGETGVFTLWTLFGPPQWIDLPLVNSVAEDVKDRLRGYPGPVRAGMCRALEPAITPRWWYRAETQAGCWVMGLNWVIPWLEHFDNHHGLGAKDIERFDTLAGPHWGRPTTAVPPGIPDLDSWQPHG